MQDELHPGELEIVEVGSVPIPRCIHGQIWKVCPICKPDKIYDQVHPSEPRQVARP